MIGELGAEDRGENKTFNMRFMEVLFGLLSASLEEIPGMFVGGLMMREISEGCSWQVVLMISRSLSKEDGVSSGGC